ISDNASHRYELPGIRLKVFDELVEFVLCGPSVALFTLSNQIEMFQCDAREARFLGRNLDAVHSGGVRYDGTDKRHVDRQRCWTSALFGAFSSKLDQPLSIERCQLDAPELSLERRHHGSFGPARGPANFAHVFIVQVNDVTKCANVPNHAWLRRSVAVDIALHFERPFFAVLASSKRLGHITGLAADLDAPISGCQLNEGRHACALRLSCALCVH